MSQTISAKDLERRSRRARRADRDATPEEAEAAAVEVAQDFRQVFIDLADR